MKLRWYQTEAIRKAYDQLIHNPCVVLPTGSGKSYVIAQIASDITEKWDGRCLILAHRKELLQQNREKLLEINPDLNVGIYSAGLKSRQLNHPVVLAGIHSIYKKGDVIGKFDVVIVDEAHLIPHSASLTRGDGMYRFLISSLKDTNPILRVVGLTATPFRMKGGSICREDGLFGGICYEAPLRALITQGFLTNLVSYSGTKTGRIDTEGVSVLAGEFVQGQIELKALVEGRVSAAVKDILEKTADRKKVLIFTCSIRHCEQVALELTYQDAKGKVAFVTGHTLPEERDRIVKEFRSGSLRYLVNVEVFTEGLDVPHVDCIVLLRPTRSAGLYVQMVGRGFRVAEGKPNCLVLDYGDNILRHGPVDTVKAKEPGKKKGEAPAKECPECSMVIAAGYSNCPGCQYEFPKPQIVHNRTSSTAPVMEPPPQWVDVDRVSYHVHTKKGATEDAPKSVRVTYHAGFYSISEWVCVEHKGYARMKAVAWWKKRQKLGDELLCPQAAYEAVLYLQQHRLRESGRILVKNGYGQNKYDTILEHEVRLNDGSLLSDQKPAPPEEEGVEVPF